MKGCLGCLGALVILALLAWPIEVLAQLLGWSDVQTGTALLLVLGLLAIATFRRGPMAGRSASGTTRRHMPVTLETHRPATEGIRDEDSLPRDIPRRRRYLHRPDPIAAGGSPRDEWLFHKARDSVPAQLRFSVLQCDGFRCRYCGRPGARPRCASRGPRRARSWLAARQLRTTSGLPARSATSARPRGVAASASR